MEPSMNQRRLCGADPTALAQRCIRLLRAVTTHAHCAALAILLLPNSALLSWGANLPEKSYRVSFLSPTFFGQYLDDRGNIFGGDSTRPRNFAVYRPAIDGNKPPGTQFIPYPV